MHPKHAMRLQCAWSVQVRILPFRRHGGRHRNVSIPGCTWPGSPFPPLLNTRTHTSASIFALARVPRALFSTTDP